MFFFSIISKSQIIVLIVLGHLLISPVLYADDHTQKLDTLKSRNQKSDKIRIQFTENELTWLKENPSIRLGFNPDMLPLLIYHTDGKNSGILPDIFTQLEKFTGLNVSIEVGPWHEIINQAASGKIDGLLLCVPDLARAKGLLSTKEYISTRAVAFGKNDAPFTINSIKDLKGKRIAYMRAVKFIENIIAPLKSDVTAIETESFIAALTMVLEGKADIALGMNFDTYLLHESVLTGIEPIFIDASQAVKAVTAVRPEWPELVSILNKGLSAIGEANINNTMGKWTQIESPAQKLVLTDSERIWLKNHPIVRIGADPAWDPIEFLDIDGNYKGLAIEYLKKIEPLLGIEFKFVQENWQDLIARAKRKELDLFTCVAVTPEREQYLLFTKPYIQMPAGIFAQKDVAYITDLRMISDKKIAVVEGYAIHDYLSANYPEMNLVMANTPEDGIRKVISKEVFAYIDNIITTGHIISHKGYLGIKMVGEAPFVYAQSMGVRRDWPLFRNILEKAISTIPDGERNAIYNQWVPVTYEKPADYSLLWKIGSGCLILVCLIFFWNRKLATEVNRQTREYRKSENRFRSTFDDAGIGMGLVSLEGNWLRVNQALCSIVGYTDDELEELTFQHITYPDDLKRNLASIGDLIDGKTNSCEMETRYLHRNGSVIWIQLNVSLLRNENDEPLNLLKQIQNITDRKHAVETLKDNQKFLDSIIEQSPYPTWISDTKGTMIRANPALKKVLNLSDEQLIGKYNAFEDKQIEPDILQVLHDVLKKGKTIDYELDWVGSKAGIKEVEDGNRVYCEGTMFPIYNQKSTITHAVITYKDVSDRKEAEEALLRNKEEMQAIVDHSVDAIGVSQQGIHKLVNPAYLTMFGYQNAKELIGKPIFELIAPDERKRIKQFVSDRIKGISVGSHYQTRGLKKDGTEFDMEVNVAQYGQEDIKNTLVILRDVTDRNRLEEQLRQSQKMESIGNLAGGIAHDFNNLLFPIIGMSEMLLEDLPENSLEYENAEEIFRAGKRAGDLVNQILAFSRQSEHKMSPVRVQNVLKEVLKLSRSTIPTNIEIQQNIQQDGGLVMADPTQIHQIGMNLITNAFHALENKNGTIVIELKEITLKNNELSGSGLQPGQYIKLSVSDNGTGMSENTTQKIFEPYFTTKEQGKGTGLGLAVLYGIVKEHKGEINVDSELGQGTTFNVYLPLMKKFSEVAVVDNVERAETGSERILLVDDEVSVAKLEGQILSRLGYQVTIKTSSNDALDTFKGNPNSFDLVISDMTMPDMTGDTLAKEILSIKSDIPIIICTGFSERINKEQAVVLGIKGLLMKPVVKSDMAHMIRNVLDEAKNS